MKNSELKYQQALGEYQQLGTKDIHRGKKRPQKFTSHQLKHLKKIKVAYKNTLRKILGGNTQPISQKLEPQCSRTWSSKDPTPPLPPGTKSHKSSMN